MNTASRVPSSRMALQQIFFVNRVRASLLIFVIGLSFASFASIWSRQSIENQGRAAFDRNVDRVKLEIAQRLRQAIYGMGGLKAMYAVTGEANRKQFQSHIESIDLKRDFPGLRGFGFIQHVKRDSIGAFLSATRADGASQFAIRQLGDKIHDDLYVIKYIEPALENINAEGLDVGSEPRRREAIQIAVDTGKPTLSAAIKLVQQNGDTPGALLFIPMYRRGTDPTSVSQRRAALIGVVYAPLVYEELLKHLAEVELE